MRQLLTFNIVPKHLWKLVFYLSIINLLVLTGTVLFTIYYRQDLDSNWDSGSVIKYALIQLDLSRENVLAAWYSSVVLLLVSLVSGLCFLVERQAKQEKYSVLQYGWLAYVGIFALLSLDEVGSIHERLGMLPSLNPFGDYALGWAHILTPFIMLVGGFMLLFSWMRLKHNKLALALMVLGVILFLSVPFQEHLEMLMLETSGESVDSWERPIQFLLLEEGSELYGMLAFLAATVSQFIFLASRGKSVFSTPSNVVAIPLKIRSIFVTLAILTVSSGFLMFLLDAWQFGTLVGDNGIPLNWFPGALAILVTFFCLQLGFTVSHRSFLNRQINRLLIIFSLLLSAYYGGAIKTWISSDVFQINRVDDFVYSLILFTATVLAIGLAFYTTSGLEKLFWGGWVTLLALLISFGTIYAADLVDLLAMAMLLFTVIFRLYQFQQIRLNSTSLTHIPHDKISLST